jgi:hypothetical protein
VEKSRQDPIVDARALWLETDPLSTISDQTRSTGQTSGVVNNSNLRDGGRPRERGPNDETKPIEKAVTSITSFRQFETNRRMLAKTQVRLLNVPAATPSVMGSRPRP